MPYVVAGQSVMSLTLKASHEFQEVMTVLHYRLDKPEDEDIPDGVQALNSFWTLISGPDSLYEKWRACLSVKVTDIKVNLQWITNDRFAIRTYLKEGHQEGMLAGDAYPVNTSVAITKRTDVAGRSQVGTIHMPGVAISSLLNGKVTGDAVQLYADFANAARTVIATANPIATFLPVIFNRVNPFTSPQIQNVIVQPQARIMRRRTVGLGI